MTPDRTVTEVASELQCSPKKVRRLAAAGTLPAYRLGRDWRFRPNAVEQLRQRLAHKPVDTALQAVDRVAPRTGGRLKGWNKFA
ncbi:MAG: helix-turn-helix domain-containing protein [Acidobacteriota bacterium]|nr:helix-turn-helix domain-containing protein [Acidobacteriota bacterium]